MIDRNSKWEIKIILKYIQSRLCWMILQLVQTIHKLYVVNVIKFDEILLEAVRTSQVLLSEKKLNMEN